jgi:hypothetical protein
MALSTLRTFPTDLILHSEVLVEPKGKEQRLSHIIV